MNDVISLKIEFPAAVDVENWYENICKSSDINPFLFEINYIIPFEYYRIKVHWHFSSRHL